jgi:hypothetical protein
MAAVRTVNLHCFDTLGGRLPRQAQPRGSV